MPSEQTVSQQWYQKPFCLQNALLTIIPFSLPLPKAMNILFSFFSPQLVHILWTPSNSSDAPVQIPQYLCPLNAVIPQACIDVDSGNPDYSEQGFLTFIQLETPPPPQWIAQYVPLDKISSSSPVLNRLVLNRSTNVTSEDLNILYN